MIVDVEQDRQNHDRLEMEWCAPPAVYIVVVSCALRLGRTRISSGRLPTLTFSRT